MISFVDFIDKNETFVKHYVYKMSHIDKQVRNGSYPNYVQPFTIVEKMYLCIISFFLNIVLLKYRPFYRIDWKFAKTIRNIENDFPHTHHDIIFLPWDFYELKSTNLIKTIIHEKIHIYQRFNPIPTLQLYIHYWELKLHSMEVEDQERCNPDINLIKFAYYNPVLDKMVYNYQKYDNNPKSLSNSFVEHIILSDQIVNNTQIYYDIIQSNKYQSEHPNEVMACLLTNIIVNNVTHAPTERWFKSLN